MIYSVVLRQIHSARVADNMQIMGRRSKITEFITTINSKTLLKFASSFSVLCPHTISEVIHPDLVAQHLSGALVNHVSQNHLPTSY